VSESEFAFLALGLILGAASGAALGEVLRSRPPSREIRLTVTHGAVPKRSSTLSSDAAMSTAAAPAPGGPADRRLSDREPDSTAIDRRFRAPIQPLTVAPARAARAAEVRTPVLSERMVGIRIEPEPDDFLARLRSPAPDRTLLTAILHGDHRAMLTTLDAIAGEDPARRRAWEGLIAGLAEALIERAIDLGVMDFPIGTAFWDSFTVDQCRQIAGALASMGYRFDGHDGWEGGRAPNYRDLSTAVADTGVEPRRLRAWPNQDEIGALYRGARAAPDDAVARLAPSLEADALIELLGPRADVVRDLWVAWDSIRPLLLAPVPTTV